MSYVESSNICFHYNLSGLDLHRIWARIARFWGLGYLFWGLYMGRTSSSTMACWVFEEQGTKPSFFVLNLESNISYSDWCCCCGFVEGKVFRNEDLASIISFHSIGLVTHHPLLGLGVFRTQQHRLGFQVYLPSHLRRIFPVVGYRAHHLLFNFFVLSSSLPGEGAGC